MVNSLSNKDCIALVVWVFGLIRFWLVVEGVVIKIFELIKIASDQYVWEIIRNPDFEVAVALVDSAQALKAREAVRRKLPEDCQCVLSLTNEETFELVLVPSKEIAPIIRFSKLEAANYDILNDDMVRILSELAEWVQFHIEIIGRDFVEIFIDRFLMLPSSVAKKLFEICADLSQSDLYYDEKTLGEYFQNGNKSVTLWWD